jgi:hypothetical protein
LFKDPVIQLSEPSHHLFQTPELSKNDTNVEAMSLNPSVIKRKKNKKTTSNT